MIQITLFLMFFRDVQCALHNDRNIEKVMFAHIKGVREITAVCFSTRINNLNCFTCKLKKIDRV